VWSTVALNYGDVANYLPSVKASHFMGDKRACVGTQRHCDFQKKGWIEEEIIEWNEGESFKLKFLQSSMPMKMMESKFHFKEVDGKTEMTQEFWFRMGGIMGFMSGMMKGSMTKMLNDGMDGLDQHLSSN